MEMTDIEKRTGMTEQEADALDEYYTLHPPKLDPAKNTLKTKPYHAVFIDEFSVNFINTKARISGKTPDVVIADMVRHEMAYA
jgi:hypothetical protein